MYFSLIFFDQAVIYDLWVQAAVESPAKPRSIWRNPLLCIKPAWPGTKK